MQIKTRFEHRFFEPDLSKRSWEPDTSIDDVLKEILKYKTEIKEYDIVDFEVFVYKHWFYCCAAAPFMEMCYDFDDLVKLLNNSFAGDIIEIWILTEEPKRFVINCPNQDGLFPKKGAY